MYSCLRVCPCRAYEIPHECFVLLVLVSIFYKRDLDDNMYLLIFKSEEYPTW